MNSVQCEEGKEVGILYTALTEEAEGWILCSFKRKRKEEYSTPQWQMKRKDEFCAVLRGGGRRNFVQREEKELM
jgi:hypothetical protein